MRKQLSESGLCTRSGSLRGTHSLAYLDEMARVLGTVRAAAHRAWLVLQRISSAFMLDRSAG